MVLLGEHAHVRIHDNLDSNIVWYKTLVDTNSIYASLQATVPDLLSGGVSRNALGCRSYCGRTGISGMTER